MRRLALLAAVVTAATVGVAPTQAAPPRNPLILCDKATSADRSGEPSSLDIHWATISHDKGRWIAVLKLDTTDSSKDANRVLGRRWAVTVQVNGKYYSFGRRRPFGLAESHTYEFSGPAGSPTPQVKETTNTVTWTVPRSAIPGPAKPKCAVTATSHNGMTSSDAAA